MRLTQVLVVIAASFLVASEALSMITDSTQVKLSEVASPSDPSQRLLRTHPQIVEDEDGSSEERTITSRQWAKIEKYAKEVLDIDWKRAQKSTSYLQGHDRYQDYLNKIEYYRAKNPKNHGPNKITYWCLGHTPTAKVAPKKPDNLLTRTGVVRVKETTMISTMASPEVVEVGTDTYRKMQTLRGQTGTCS